MGPLELATLAAVVVAAVLVVVVLVRAGRQERVLRDELVRLKSDLATGQVDLIDRFHARLGEFGQLLSGDQAKTGDALRRELEESRRTLEQQLQGLRGSVDGRLGESQKTLDTRLGDATKVFGELRGQLGQVAEMATRMEALGREIDELQGILKAPKLRGQLGESQLEECLRQLLPPTAWEAQYRFADGQTVDAVIRLRDHLVPVDAKFPLESLQRLLAASDDEARKQARREFVRSVKGRIDEISSKYIRPGEGTFEFALMFIPAENVYYEVIVRDDSLGDEGSLLAYAAAKRVVPVSPNSFYAYLSTIVTGLKGMQVEARAREILAELGRLQREFERFAEAFRLVGRHLQSARGQYDLAEKRAVRLGQRLGTITGEPVEELEPGTPEVLPPGDE
jgi:DNA recombination protein RmuC